jgi:uroporphyrinogen-III synthase
MTIARDLGLQSEVFIALCKYTAIASVGPVMTSALEAAGIPVEIVPAHPKMGALVKPAAEMTAAILVQKRATGRQLGSYLLAD